MLNRVTPPAHVMVAVDAAKRYFEGEQIDFSDLQLDLGGQDEFFKQIYAAARRVGWGQTTTYGALAKQVGVGPEAARDVGQAMAKNPVPLIIPCHRVLAAGGKLGGFSAPGGSATKQRMLELEGVASRRPPRRAALARHLSATEAYGGAAFQNRASKPRDAGKAQGRRATDCSTSALRPAERS